MLPATPRSLAARWYGDVLAGNEDAADEIVAAGCIWHAPDVPRELTHGLEGIKTFATLLRAAFPDGQMVTGPVAVDGNTVAVGWILRATHQGEYAGALPTGRCITLQGIDIFRIADHRISEIWTNWDQLGLLRQLSAWPTVPCTSSLWR